MIFDSSKGVETQTELVWQQADNYKIPKLTFLNKLDKAGADFEGNIEDIKRKLGVKPLVLQLPIWNQENGEECLNC